MTVIQEPEGGGRRVYCRGDILTIRLRLDRDLPGTALVRSNLHRAAVRRREIIEALEARRPILARDWHDIPMRRLGPGEYELRLPLLETGRFEAKAFFYPEEGKPVWAPGENLVLRVLPAHTICGNSIYTAFPRQFRKDFEPDTAMDEAVARLDERGYAVIPPSGTFRDLIARLDVIMGEMGFRVLQLLPVHPVPTTFARMGRFGSPFASRDFHAVDPALAEFDRRATPMEQFAELVDAVHARGGYLFIDLPANHTGWASRLQLHHPEWFERESDGTFVNPGAWGVVWEDLCKLSFADEELWTYLAEVFLHWCAHGVDGFRCDAGYMIPMPVWRYVVAKVREQYPDTVFLLEGLGGSLEVTESLMSEGGMDWAYSELFQCLSAESLRQCIMLTKRQSMECGIMVHFAETHDNDRLAAVSPRHARFRCALAALFSHAGGFGIANGVEWYADVKIDVHGASPLNWGRAENQVEHLSRLLRICAEHPAFARGSHVDVLPIGDEPLVGCVRTAPTGEILLILANTDAADSHMASWERFDREGEDDLVHDLLSDKDIPVERDHGHCRCLVQPESILCLDVHAMPAADSANAGGEPEFAMLQRWRAAALEVRTFFASYDHVEPGEEERLAAQFRRDPHGFLRAVAGKGSYCPGIVWDAGRDFKRAVMVPPMHVLLLESENPFRVDVMDGARCVKRFVSLPREASGHVACLCLPPPDEPRELLLRVTCFGDEIVHRQGRIVLLPSEPPARVRLHVDGSRIRKDDLFALCTDDRGAMAQVRARWGDITSQYDAFLAANPDPEVPVDRRVLLTRLRAWIVYRDFSQELNDECQIGFGTDMENHVVWEFDMPLGMGRRIPLRVVLTMAEHGNRVAVRFERLGADGEDDVLADADEVTLIVRPDIEDRSCHETTRAWAGPEHLFRHAVTPDAAGFRFAPSSERALVCDIDRGVYVHEPEWAYMVPHPLEAERGLAGEGDLFSPGYFRAELAGGEGLVVRAGLNGLDTPKNAPPKCFSESLPLTEVMELALRRFVVKRHEDYTVIAGYPWFLDWGRDTLICLRGILAAGMHSEARGIIGQFAGFERDGTLPNMVQGHDTSNRDTSDAPLWLSVAVQDYLKTTGDESLLDDRCGDRSLRHVLVAIGQNLCLGTPNGVRLDPESALIFSPAHYTWMDTNYPAGTPRQGYPIEIQALWFATLSFLADIAPGEGAWSTLASRVRESVRRMYVLPPGQGLRDCLHASSGFMPAAAAVGDNACRPNQLLAITLGLIDDVPLGASILEACAGLLVPGGIRSLADAPVDPPLPVEHDGRLLNDPRHPYWGHYRGDEDTQRKPSYHNGTAWSWLYPSFAEALVQVHGEAALPAARSLLGAMTASMEAGCLGHVAEIVDGDWPHTQRGCRAQAWGISELLRVVRSLM